MKVIMIDDNKDLTEITCELLGMIGYEAIAALDGTEGIAKAKEFQPKAILCDIGLPGMNGYEVAQNIRLDDELKDVYLIAMSGYSRQEDIERSREAGFNRHLSKPVNLDTLKMVLDEVLKN